MKIKKLAPTCDLRTVKDGRGGIFTWLPKDPIVEFNFVFIKANKLRGNHYHPEFDEYFLITEGQGVIVSKSSKKAKEEFLYILWEVAERADILEERFFGGDSN